MSRFSFFISNSERVCAGGKGDVKVKTGSFCYNSNDLNRKQALWIKLKKDAVGKRPRRIRRRLSRCYSKDFPERV
jgi:hypothetical protein